MRVRPGCRVGEVHLLDWSPQLLLLSHLLHNSSLDIYFCFVQTRVKFMIFERLLSLKHCWKTLPWSFSLFCPHLFFAQSLLLLPCLENLKRSVWDKIGIAWYCAVLRAGYWEPEVGHLRQAWLGTFAQTWRSHEVPSLPLLQANRILIWFRDEKIISSLVPVSLYNWNCGSPGWGL